MATEFCMPFRFKSTIIDCLDEQKMELKDKIREVDAYERGEIKSAERRARLRATAAIITGYVDMKALRETYEKLQNSKQETIDFIASIPTCKEKAEGA